MSLPAFSEWGDLPEGVHQASLADVVARFGSGSPQREEVTSRLRRICELAAQTAALDRLIVFGSYVTAKREPNDIDVVLVMRDGFRPEDCRPDSRVLFDHNRAATELGASIFWIRPGMLLGDTLERFVAYWQVTREGRKRGIVEVRE
jgi:hypothetical protein